MKKSYTAHLSFADAVHGYAPGQSYELDEADAAHYVELGWLSDDSPEPVKAPAPDSPKPVSKRTRKPKVEKAVEPAAVETATL